ncbi:hypothetical protein EDC40_107143 [Aminobacter aminovorans]|uniref:Protein of uncharacterized function (DUF1365) n=1 Tax=Aminobacter aminovorans TaxID=83263 RepID=A0A381IML9_AMIAI|nr:DUF1365 domain-containing protein [Aminobacter aminovorans]TCS24944.1 hypothetical protein EDC40_107143 [Aminobacter aminovorans]SUY28654.1 Protein of uncharacterised function (DUF1365) [Aminobacter aminovorans]
MNGQSAIFLGDVMHIRMRPRRHRLSYRVFSLLLDLDELKAISSTSRVFRYNARAVLSFWDADHGDGSPDGLRAWIDARLHQAGRLEEGMRIRVLCYPRILGYVFNPLTVYFCYASDGALRAILYEVCNTFGERHTYVIPVEDGTSGAVRQRCAKELYVSPFMPMSCFYRFHIEPPDDRVLVRIDESDADGQLLVASFSGRREALTDRALMRALFRYPLMTLKVTIGIYWEALRIWTKGVPVYRHSAAASRVATTVVPPKEANSSP